MCLSHLVLCEHSITPILFKQCSSKTICVHRYLKLFSKQILRQPCSTAVRGMETYELCVCAIADLNVGGVVYLCSWTILGWLQPNEIARTFPNPTNRDPMYR